MFFFFKQKTAYEMRISDWSSDVCSSDLLLSAGRPPVTPMPMNEVLQSVARIARCDHLVLVFSDFDEIDETTHRLVAGLSRRSEERRVGKECVSTCSSRWSP